MRHAPASPVLVLALALACGGHESRTVAPGGGGGSGGDETADDGDPIRDPFANLPPTLRLDRRAVPSGYAVELTLDPAKDTFTGAITIPVELTRATRTIWLHAKDLTVATATVAVDGKNVTATVSQREEFLGLVLPSSMGPGEATIQIAYAGKLPDDQVHGLFRQSEAGATYLYSQFEATEARRAFPCFDEPSFKVPWQLTLHVPKGMVALSNTMPEREGDDGDQHTVVFAKTRPLPSYLVALAVGPFELVDLGTAGMKKTPMRIAVPRGRSAETRYAKQITGDLLEGLERYLGIPYPYDKLDSVAIPTFLGAMENAGLVTYSSSIILAKPGEESIEFQQGYATTGAHELAHHWFGNMVTMEWWDDIWLNESFADFLADRVVDDWQPSWGIRLDRLQTTQRAFAADSLVSARKIHAPIKVHNDIIGVFDAISYAKGGSVLAMFEAWVGRDVFQKTLHDYLVAHAWGNATSKDFIDALAAASRPELSAAFSTFLDQGGIPMVTLDVSCDGAAAQLVLGQERFLPIGSTGSSQQRWLVPMCVAVPKGTGVTSQCFLLDDASKRITLEQPGCPAWVDGNAGGSGYYRVKYARDLGAQLLAAKTIDTVSRAAALFNLRAMVDGGHLPMGDLLAVMPDVAGDKNPELVTVAVELATGIEPYVEDAQHAAYARFLGRSFAGPARALGWKPKKGESATTAGLRTQLLAVAALVAQDPALVAQARKLAAAYLRTPSSLEPQTGAIALATATRAGDVALARRLEAAFTKTEDHHLRAAILAGMVMSTDAAVRAKAIARLADDSLTLEEIFTLVYTSVSAPTSKAEVYAFTVAHLDQVMASLPFLVRPNIVRFASFYCDDQRRQDLATLFKPKVQDMPGGAKALGEVVEGLDLCMAKKKALGPEIARFLAQ